MPGWLLAYTLPPWSSMTFFTIDSPVAAESCRTGLEHMRGPMKGKFNAYIADSEFNKQNMIDMGYKADEIEVIPVCVPFDDYKQTPDKAMVKRMSDGITNIVFVGRIAPNKKHEDIIRAYAYYKKHVNPDSRLIQREYDGNVLPRPDGLHRGAGGRGHRVPRSHQLCGDPCHL